MRKTNMEIEFKTAIDKSTYDKMLKLFDLESNIFMQTNYYFDTSDLKLNRMKIVLRIRKKGEDKYKVTLKKRSGRGALESHVLLTPEKAKNMIKNGFQTKEFFDDVDMFVEFRASLDNYRVSTHYKEGVLFFDRSDYHGITDYEIEYEVTDYEEGKKIFDEFLKEHKIRFEARSRKSERALRLT